MLAVHRNFTAYWNLYRAVDRIEAFFFAIVGLLFFLPSDAV
jgi:hypothetical protein